MTDDDQTDPRGVPTITSEEYRELRRRIEEFEAPADVEAGIDRHRSALRDDR